jgi:methyl-accepting chemotaxis protein
VAKANIKTGKKNVHFHCIRKFTYSRLRRIDRDFAKIICGKSVSVSDMTYEEIEDQAEKVFRLAYRNIALNGNLMGTAKQKQEERIKHLEDAIVTLSKDLQASKTVSETVTKRYEEIEKENKKLRQIIELHGIKLQETSETFKEINERLLNIERELKIKRPFIFGKREKLR